jgi:cyclopropane fatty-acyl-phospholipid synthase-like methyltransferase
LRGDRRLRAADPGTEVRAGAARRRAVCSDQSEGRRRDAEMAKVTKNDVVYDLGCGDGRIVITAAGITARRASALILIRNASGKPTKTRKKRASPRK